MNEKWKFRKQERELSRLKVFTLIELLNVIITIGILAGLLLPSSISAAEKAQVKISKITAAPAIDGKGSDPCWLKLPYYQGFSLINQLGKKAPQDTRFKIAHDNNNLYFLVEAFESDPSKLKAKATERDSGMGRDDCVEIFIDPNRDGERFYQFMVNPKGAVYDAEYLQGGILAFREWNSRGLKIGTSITRNSFIVELSIPLVDLGLENTDGRMGVNITRESLSKGAVLSSFVPINGSFLQPGVFASAQLENCDLKHFAWKIDGPLNASIIRRNGQIAYEGKFFIGNNSGKLRFAVLTAGFGDGPRFRENVIMEHGLKREYAFSLPVDPAIPNQMLQVNLFDKKTGVSFADRQIPVSVSYSPLVMTLTDPPYRDNIYSDMNLKEITGDLIIREAGTEKLPVTFELSDSKGKILASCKGVGSCKFRLPVPQLKEGSYQLTARAGIYRTTKTIRKLPKVKGEIRFDKNRIMYVDGKPFIPYGGFSSKLDRDSKLGFNICFSYVGSYMHGDGLQKAFDQYAEHGMKCTINCYPTNKLYKDGAMRNPLSKQEADLIRSRIRELRNHPALLGWYLYDEPEAVPVLPSRMKAIFEICKEEDPHHPAIILNNTAAGYRKYAESGDITMPDIYPNFIIGGDAGKPISNVYYQMKDSAGVNSRIQWVTPQAFNWGDFGRAGQRMPNFTELRNMHYQGLLAGATGFCWYSFADLDSEPEVYLGLAQLLKEARILKDIWFNGYRKQMLSTGSPDVLAASYPGNNGRNYIVVVNCATAARKITLPAAGKKYFAAGEKQSFTPVKGKLTDELKKYQVRVYLTDQKLAESFSLDEYKPKVAEAMKKLHKKGNLAYFRSSKVRFELSWNKNNTGVWHLGDGAFDMVFWIKKNKNLSVSAEFPETVKASRICLFGKNLRKGVVEAEQNGKWVKLADLKPVSEQQMEASFQSVSGKKFRISDLVAEGITEIEIY